MTCKIMTGLVYVTQAYSESCKIISPFSEWDLQLAFSKELIEDFVLKTGNFSTRRTADTWFWDHTNTIEVVQIIYHKCEYYIV